ncbi:MAG: hypothetical protein WC091_22080 [Sulfuricellaceae bacterium]
MKTLKNLILAFAILIPVLPAQAADDPIEQLKNAFAQAQAQQNDNGFAGYSSSCVSVSLFTKGGVIASNRQCVGRWVTKEFIEKFASDKGYQFVFRNQYMDLLQITPSTMPKGSAYYQVYYDDAGNANEIAVVNDALP